MDLRSDLTVLVLVLFLSASDEALQGRLQDLDRSFSFPQSALVVQLSTARAGLTHCPEARAYLQADWPVRGQDGCRDDRHRDARYQVFRDLRGRGFYLTSAGKFGGDFLVYPGECFKFTGSILAGSGVGDQTEVLVCSGFQVTPFGSTLTSSPFVCLWTSPSVCSTS